MGLDGIPPIILLKCASVLYRRFHYLFSLILRHNYLPSDWKIHLIKDFKKLEQLQCQAMVQNIFLVSDYKTQLIH